MIPLVRFLFIFLFASLPFGALLIYFEPWEPFFTWESLTHTWSVGMIFGILTYSAVVIQFFLGSRIKILDRLFGQDKLIRFHGFLGLMILVIIGGHVISKNLSTYETTFQVYLGLGASSIFNLIIVLSALLMSPIILSRWYPLVELRRWTAHRLRLRYNTLRIVHNLVSVAGILAALHVLFASSTLEKELRMVYMLGWFMVGFGFYVYHRLIKVFILRRRPWTVTAVEALTESVVQVTMRSPEDFRQKAGQFAYLTFLQDGFPSEEHPFTLASAPGTMVTILAKKSGTYTQRLGELKPGAQALVDGPYGLFTLDSSRKASSLVFLAGGIGITPFLSMIRSLGPGFGRPVHLVWNTTTIDEAFAHPELKALAVQESQFSYDLILSRQDHPEARRGRLNFGVLSELVDVTPEKMYYLCGPVAQMEALIKGLLDHGVGASRIVFERFSF